MATFKDLTGMKFGNFTAIEVAGKFGKFSAWLCKCDCGNEDIQRVDYLTSGRTIKCERCRKLDTMKSQEVKRQTEKQKSKLKQKKHSIKYYPEGDYLVGVTHLNRKFYIDVEDYEKIKELNIVVNKLGYAKFNTNGIQYHLHRFLMSPEKHEIIDHINRKPYDNRKCNLRICSRTENSWNKSTNSNNKSGVNGVKQQGDFWTASIGVSNETINLGYYKNKEEAILARKEAEQTYYGEFAPK